MVTHDRYFLESTCQSIFELDRGAMYRHSGSYSSFLEAKAEREIQEAKEVELAKKQVWCRV
jgi:ATP-binding cassette subfamily F protein uup